MGFTNFYSEMASLRADIEALKLALYGRITGLDANQLLGSGAEGGVAEPIPQSNFVDITSTQNNIGGAKTFTGSIIFSNSTPATSTTTGTTFAGGIGVGGAGYFGVGIQAPNVWLLEPRSSVTVIDANSLIFSQFAGTKWLDGSVTNLNFPTNAGMLHQFNPLPGTSVDNKYRVQEYLQASTGTNARFWKRTENNGTWGNWLEIAFLEKANTWPGIQNFTTQINLGGNKVLGPRDTGWSAATGTATKTTFTTSTVTLPQLAERVKAIIDAGIAHGFLGT